MVYIAECQAFRTRDVIEFIPKIAILGVEQGKELDAKNKSAEKIDTGCD